MISSPISEYSQKPQKISYKNDWGNFFMMEVIDNNIGSLAGFFGTASIIALFDAIAPQSLRIKIANFIFGAHNISLKEFEHNVIAALLSPFQNESRLTFSRIALWTFGVCFLATYTLAFSYKIPISHILELDELWVLLVSLPTLVFLVSLVSFPCDIWSFFITKKLFLDSKPPAFWFAVFWILDILISSLPILVVAFVLSIMFGEFRAAESVITGAFWLNFSSSVVLSLIQLVTVAVGVFLRSVIFLTRLNMYTIAYTELHNYPFTFLGILFASIWNLAYVASI